MNHEMIRVGGKVGTSTGLICDTDREPWPCAVETVRRNAHEAMPLNDAEVEYLRFDDDERWQDEHEAAHTEWGNCADPFCWRNQP